jgi:hypothetical protein
VVLTLIVQAVSVALVPEMRSGAEFSLTRASLIGRPDVVRLWAISCAECYSWGFCVALAARTILVKRALLLSQ